MDQKLNVTVVPYLIGDMLNISVNINGIEVSEHEQKLSTLFTHFAECVDPYRQDDEDETYLLIEALEDGLYTLNDVLV